MLWNGGSIEALREEVDFARLEVPFFAEHLTRRSGINGVDIRSADDLARILPTQKADYRTNFPGGIIAGCWDIEDPMITRLQSSGSEGDRLVTLIHTFTLADRMSSSVQINPRLHYLMDVPRMKACRYAAPNCSDVECANPNISMEDRILPDGTLVLSVYHDLLSTPPTMLRQAYKEICDYRPNYLYVDPNHLCFLMDFMLGQGLSVKEWGQDFSVLCTYSYLTQNLRRRLRAHLGAAIPVVNVLAMSELGFVALECEHGHLHINNSDFYVELLDDSGRQVPFGQLGELCITTLGDRLSPKIRYLTGDLYTPLDLPCRCGSSFPVVNYIGRRRYSFELPSGKRLAAADIDEIVGDRLWMLQYQCERVRSNQYVFRYIVEGRDVPNDQLGQIRDGLSACLEGAKVRMELTDYIPAEHSGKFLTCRPGLR